MRISDWSSDVCSSDLDGRMTFRSSLIGLASDQVPPPKGAASASLTNDQVTASSKPAEAAARRRRRSISCSGVAVGFATPSARGSGTDAIASKPVMRRSEEHTSELQSLMRISYAVFCLKKKKN